MPAQPQFFDMSVSVTPPGGYAEPLPITLGPNWLPNDVRIAFVTGSGSDAGSDTELEMIMTPDPPTGFASAYTRFPGHETHGVYSRRMAFGDSDTSVSWVKPASWRHFMFGLITARGLDPSSSITAGPLSFSQTEGDSQVVVSSVSVPSAGTMVFFAGSVPLPSGGSGWPAWAVAMGVPTGWTPLVATDKSGINFYSYDTNPSIVAVAKNFASTGSTGSVAIPTALGAPAYTGLYAFLTPAPDVSVTISAA
jgi:hypothetical protein